MSPKVLAYLVPTLIAVVAVQTWFQPGMVIAFGDIPPPIEPNAQYRSHWNQVLSGEGAPAYDIVSLGYLEPLRLAASFGAEALFQRLWFTMLVTGSVAAAVFFAFGLTRTPLVAGAAGTFAMLNASRLTGAGDWMPSLTLLAAGVLGGIVLRAGLRHRTRPSALSFALASLAMSLIFINPPHVYLVMLWIGASLVFVAAAGGIASLRNAVLFLAKAVPLAVLVNVWWLVPAALTILGASFDARFAAAGVDEWEWTHARSSLANVVSLNSTWAWTSPEFYPYAERLSNAPFDVLRYLVPATAALGVVLARGAERRAAVALAAVAVVLVWLGKGVHPPLPSASKWLYANLPGYWLLREPVKVLVLLNLVLAILAGIALARLLRGKTFPLPPLVSKTLAVVIVLGSLAYVHPLFSGEVVPDERPRHEEQAAFPPAHVDVPPGWKQAIRFLDNQPHDGKVLALPRPDFYSLPTTWGYYGVSFARFALDRPVLEGLPGGGYFGTSESVDSLLASIEDDLRGPDAAAVVPKARALGVRYVLLRRDLDTDFPDRRLIDPDVLARGLAGVPGLRRVRSFGVVDLYEFESDEIGEVFAGAGVEYGGAPAHIPGALEVAPRGFVMVEGGGGTVSRSREFARKVSLDDEIHWALDLRRGGRDLVVRFSSDPRPRAHPAHAIRRYARLPYTSPPFLLEVGPRSFIVEAVTRAWRPVDVVGGVGDSEIRTWKPIITRAPILPDVAYERVSPSEFRIRVSGAEHPYVLAVTEADAPGWNIESPGRDPSELEKVVVNGYANGWIVPWRGTYELRVFYGPEEYAATARSAGAVVVPLAALLWLGSIVIRRRRRSRPRPSSPMRHRGPLGKIRTTASGGEPGTSARTARGRGRAGRAQTDAFDSRRDDSTRQE